MSDVWPTWLDRVNYSPSNFQTWRFGRGSKFYNFSDAFTFVSPVTMVSFRVDKKFKLSGETLSSRSKKTGARGTLKWLLSFFPRQLFIEALAQQRKPSRYFQSTQKHDSYVKCIWWEWIVIVGVFDGFWFRIITDGYLRVIDIHFYNHRYYFLVLSKQQIYLN